MFYLFLIGFIGSAYLYYRYTTISDKSMFFQSALVRSFASSAGILIISAFILNILAPKKEAITVPKGLTLDFSNTTVDYLAMQNGGFHYDLIHKINVFDHYEVYRDVVRQRYEDLINDRVDAKRNVGYFGLGVYAMEARNFDVALSNFNQIRDDKFAYLHFCKGYIFNQNDKFERAETEFRLELLVPGGNYGESVHYLIDRYDEKQNFPALLELLKHPEAEKFFPDHLARMTLLNHGDAVQYLYWLFKTIYGHVNLLGLVAALAISTVWLIYLLRLDIFKSKKLSSLLLMFSAGCFSVLMVISFNDLFDVISSWARNGELVNDFFYCFLMIGIPEELTKIFPLLVLLLVRRHLKEPIDYILYASASALGFAFIENLLYFQDITDGIIHGRAYLAAIGHMVDTSFIAYGFVICRFHNKKKWRLWLTFPLSFFAGTISHGIYDFLLYQDLIYLFFIFFIFVIQVWVIIINNCLNNSSRFSYDLTSQLDESRLFMAMALTSIFALEYLLVGFSTSSEQANNQLMENASSAGFLIIFFSSNLSSFNLVRAYWRDVYFSSREKRGYGARQGQSLLLNWYFINSIKAHNYVGVRIRLYNDPYNRILDKVLDRQYEGKIVNRIMLYEKEVADPHWFIVKLDHPLLLNGMSQLYVLVKLRYQEDSLLNDDEVQVYFKGIPDLELLKVPARKKEVFPFYGWAYISMQNETVTISS